MFRETLLWVRKFLYWGYSFDQSGSF